MNKEEKDQFVDKLIARVRRNLVWENQFLENWLYAIQHPEAWLTKPKTEPDPMGPILSREFRKAKA